MIETESSGTLVDHPRHLPCGAVLKNRIAKAAMSDSLGDGAGRPTPAQVRLYERWAQGGVALSIIGEVQVDPRFPEKPGNLVLSPDSDPRVFRTLTRRGSAGGAHLWAQLGHAGALSYPPISVPKGPSTLDVGDIQCAAMSEDEVRGLPGQFAGAAVRAREAGFTGVQIHAAHGFLLSQFLSPLFNHRSDAYGGPIERRTRILLEVVEAVRDRVGLGFPVGVKINSTDNLEGGLTRDDAIEVLRLLDRTSIDLIDISGGTYFPGAAAASDGAGQGPYFIEFAQRARAVTNKPLMTTGGFKRRIHVQDALRSGATDMVGVARAMVLNPRLPETWLGGADDDPVFPRFESTRPGGVTAWYTMRLTALAENREDAFDVDVETAMHDYDTRDEYRCRIWREGFTGRNT